MKERRARIETGVVLLVLVLNRERGKKLGECDIAGVSVVVRSVLPLFACPMIMMPPLPLSSF